MTAPSSRVRAPAAHMMEVGESQVSVSSKMNAHTAGQTENSGGGLSVEQRLRAWDSDDVCPDLEVLFPHLRGQEFVHRGLDRKRNWTIFPGFNGQAGPNRSATMAEHAAGGLGLGRTRRCCFVLLIPTPEQYRVPRVNPGVTASKLFPPLLPSLATPGPPLPYRPLQKPGTTIRGSEWGPASAWPGLISGPGLRRGGRGIPISSLVSLYNNHDHDDDEGLYSCL